MKAVLPLTVLNVPVWSQWVLLQCSAWSLICSRSEAAELICACVKHWIICLCCVYVCFPHNLHTAGSLSILMTRIPGTWFLGQVPRNRRWKTQYGSNCRGQPLHFLFLPRHIIGCPLTHLYPGCFILNPALTVCISCFFSLFAEIKEDLIVGDVYQTGP